MKTKKSNMIKFKNIVKNKTIAFFDDYDGSYVTLIKPNSLITIKRHYYNYIFMGWNIYCDGVLLETKSTRKKAINYVEKLSS